jgi:hypothetical protein
MDRSLSEEARDHFGSDEHGGTAVMSSLLTGFNAHREEVWQRLAEEFGGEFTQQQTWQTDRVQVKVDHWTVTLDIRTVPGFKSEQHFTRLRAPYVNHEGFRFTIYRKTLLSKVAELFGMEDIETGHPHLDDNYVVQANDKAKIKRLLANARIRALIERQPDFYLHVQPAEEYDTEQFPEGVDELYFEVPELIDDAGRLRGLYELFAELLHTLTHLGSAYEDDPTLDL